MTTMDDLNVNEVKGGVEGGAKLPLLMIIIVGETLHVGLIPRLLPCFVRYVTKI